MVKVVRARVCLLCLLSVDRFSMQIYAGFIFNLLFCDMHTKTRMNVASGISLWP